MNSTINIVRKELGKVFKSPRQIFGNFLLPGLMIFLMYSLLGATGKNQILENDNHEYNIIVNIKSSNLESILKNIPKAMEEGFYSVNITKYETTLSNKELSDKLEDKSDLINEIRENIKNKNYDLFIYIDENFDKVTGKQEIGKTDIKIIAHSSNTFSQNFASNFINFISIYESSINPSNSYNLNSSLLDLASEDEIGGTMLSMLAPLLIITFIFAGALAIGTDSIAGEKERGTIATMLMAPINKKEIITGKILSAIILTVISSLCSTIGLIASISNLVNGINASGAPITFNLDFNSILITLILILFVSLMAVSLFLMASTFAKTTKEATMFAMPFYIGSILTGSLVAFSTSVPSNILPYFIPVYNLALGLKGIFLSSLDTINLVVIVISSLVYFVLIFFAISKMFKSEKIMFSR